MFIKHHIIMKITDKIFRLLFPNKSIAHIVNEYNIPREIKFQFASTKDGWIIATSPDLPGFVTEAKNPQELLEMINDGILTYYDVPKKVGDIVHKTLRIEGMGTVSLSGPYCQRTVYNGR